MLTDKYSYHPVQGNVSLQQIETIRENHNQSTCRVVKLSLNGYIYKSTLLPKAQRILRDEVEKLYEPKDQIRKFAVRLSPCNVRSYTYT